MPKRTEPTGRARGGAARANLLTAKERKEIARRAAAARWGDAKSLPQAVCGPAEGRPLRLADIEVDAYVLEDGTRVLSQAGLLRALKRNRRAATRSLEIPPVLQGAAFEPFLTPEILEAGRPLRFRTPSGTPANGYRADFLPKVCEIYLKARDAETLAPNQKPIRGQASRSR